MTSVFKKIFPVIIISSFIIGILFLFPQNSKSYDDQTTHPGLTDEIVDFYNLSFDDQLTSQEKEWIVQGAIDEDTPPRWINHFYDPTNGDGWKSENLGNLSPFTLKLITRLFLNSNTEIVSSKNWVHNEVLQLKYQDYKGNRTWENAIRKYANGDEEYAYKTLGHILHLLEDKTVPDHTRNDTHAHEGSVLTKDGGSPYEDYSSQFNRQTLTTAQDLKNENKSPIILNSIDEYIDYLANYSNNYFFSENTIKSEKYENPKILREDNKYGYGKDETNKDFPLVKKYESWNKEKKIYEIIYTLRDDDNLVLFSYFSHLSREAVMSGAGAIKLFIQEAEKAKNDKSLIKEEPKINWWQKMQSPYYGFISPAINEVKNLYSDLFKGVKLADSPVANIGQQLGNVSQNQNNLEQSNITLAPEASNQQEEIAQPIQSAQPVNQENDIAVSLQPQQPQQTSVEPQKEIIHAPYYRAPEVIHAPYQANTELAQSPANIERVSSGSITNQFQGQFNGSMQTMESTTEELDNPLFAGQNDSIETAQNDETQNQITEDTDQPQEQENAEQLSSEQDNQQDQDNAQDQNTEQNNQEQDQQTQDSESQQEVLPEPILPDINFYVSDYEVRKFDFILNWEDGNNAAQGWELQYKLASNFAWQNINVASGDSSYSFTAEYDDLTYYFRLRAQYDGGNFSDWIELPIDISSKPVVINEVAWMGTQASPNDEWIEFANKTNQEIDLMGWTLYVGNQPINITGKISPNGFYLLERTNDDPISNIVADQFYTGALTNPNGNYGQQLILQDELGNVADTTMSAYAGDNNTKKTSERVSVWASGGAGATGNNWKTYAGQGGEAQDAAGNAIMGTPRVKNSVADEFLAFNSQPSKSLIFLKNRGTVLVENGIWIPQGIKLFIEPGVVWKLSNRGSLTFSGELIARGNPEEKIVFTSTSDDEYGADINGNDSNVINWLGINFLELSKGDLNNVIVRNVGSVWISSAISINKADVKISDSVFENNSENVLVFDYVDADISNSEFKNNTGHAITVAHAGANISNSVFENNTGAGLWLGGASGDVSVSNSSFTGNKAPIETNRLTNFNISDNTVLNNTTNGIWASGGIEESQNSITISSDMPFVFSDNGTSVDGGKTLTLAPGTVFKFAQRAMGIYGTLNTIGTSDQPIVFTSLEDDVYGGDTNNDGNATMPGEGSWYWMQFVSGENSILDNVIVRYAGRLGYSMGGPPSGGSGISVEPGAVNFTMRNSTISDSVVGANISSDGTIIEGTKFANNSQTGLNIVANNATVSNITFENNQKAFQSTSAYMATILLSDFIFNGNTYNYWPEDLINYLTQ